MPLYSFRCPECGDTVDELMAIGYIKEVVCKKCSVPMRKLLGAGMKYKFKMGNFFEPYVTEHLTGDPILVKSLDHLHKIARDNNLTLRPGPEKLR